jgi:hypothetical protein
MLKILIGLVVAALLLIGWGAGSLFVCVFLTLPTAFVMLVDTKSFSQNQGHMLWFALALLAIWAPLIIRHWPPGVNKRLPSRAVSWVNPRRNSVASRGF